MKPLKKYEDRCLVKLNIYDMTPMNRYLEKLGLGVYHSGVEVFGGEYSFGGHPLNTTGIFELEPKSAEEFQSTFQYKETVLIGYTTIGKKEFRQLLESLGSRRFIGRKYHLFSNNCNHFTSDLTMLLCDSRIPDWVNRLARISSAIPLLDAILPPEVLTPTLTMAPEETYDDEKENKRKYNYIV